MKTRSAFGMALLSALVPALTGLSTALAEPLPLSAAPVGAGGPTSLVASSRSSRLDAALFVAAYDRPAGAVRSLAIGSGPRQRFSTPPDCGATSRPGPPAPMGRPCRRDRNPPRP